MSIDLKFLTSALAAQICSANVVVAVWLIRHDFYGFMVAAIVLVAIANLMALTPILLAYYRLKQRIALNSHPTPLSQNSILSENEWGWGIGILLFIVMPCGSLTTSFIYPFSHDVSLVILIRAFSIVVWLTMTIFTWMVVCRGIAQENSDTRNE